MHPDAYWTPPELTAALLVRQKFRGVVWEPACGAGNISEVVRRHGIPVVSSDVLTCYGYPSAIRHDFLTDPPHWSFANVITNPPYTGDVIRHWVRRACSFNPERIAFLLPITAFATLTDERYTGRLRLRRVVVFSRRLSVFRHANGFVFRHRWQVAWFVAELGFSGVAALHHLH